MDTISILSSVIKKNGNDEPTNDIKILNSRLKSLKKKLKIEKKLITFSSLKGWQIKNSQIFDKKKNFFSILFIDVNANKREVKNWDQPFISDHLTSLNCFIIAKINETNHYLLKIIQEPGFNSPKFTSTISEKNFPINNLKKNKFSKFLNKKNYLLDSVYSDEGGRFFKNQTRNIICKLDNYKKLKIAKNYIWASHNQIIDLIKQNRVTIEARNLFAIYNIDKIK